MARWTGGLNRRGIVLITSLLITLVVMMVVGAAISMAPQTLAASSGYTDSQRAALALDMGMEYARNRFKEDIGWTGSANSGPDVVVRTPDNSLVVVEDHGNVIGLIRFESGDYGQFRIRFNHQDGNGGLDGLDDPSSTNQLEFPAISVNNLAGSSPLQLFDTSTGVAVARQDLVSAFQAYLAVEGRAGPGLRDANPFQPNQSPSSLRVVSYSAEARFEANFGDTLDAAAMAAGDINAYLRRTRGPISDTRVREKVQLKIDAAWNNGSQSPPRIRSKGTVNVDSDRTDRQAVNLTSRNGFINTRDGNVGSTTNLSTGTNTATEDPTADFYALEWDEIHHSTPDPSAADTVNLKGCSSLTFCNQTS